MSAWQAWVNASSGEVVEVPEGSNHYTVLNENPEKFFTPEELKLYRDKYYSFVPRYPTPPEGKELDDAVKSRWIRISGYGRTIGIDLPGPNGLGEAQLAVMKNSPDADKVSLRLGDSQVKTDMKSFLLADSWRDLERLPAEAGALPTLVRLADELDRRGFVEEADRIDAILREAALWDRISNFMKKKYQKLRQLFQKKRTLPAESEEAKPQEEEADKRLNDMLQRKQTGPAEERLYVWFCHQYPNACEPCTSRHGRMRTMTQWRVEGLPGSAVCTKSMCECQLVAMGPQGVAQPAHDQDIAANSIGTREDGTLENMNQGITLAPFFSDYGNLQ